MIDQEKRDYQRQWVANRRTTYIDKMGGRCCKCGSTESLEIDHKDPEQKVSHRIFSWAVPRIEEELAKCQLLCKQCHIEKTNDDVHGGHNRHGTVYHYKKGCRCDLCREAKRKSR